MTKPAWIAAGFVVALILAILGGQIAYGEWRLARFYRIGNGATRAEVIAVLGEPANAMWGSLTPCARGAACETWQLAGQQSAVICFDARGRVICKEVFSVWY
jgi:hypothetical protein